MATRVSVLEQKILAGETVTAEAMAEAKAADDAQARIDELIKQREKAEELERKRQQVEKWNREIEGDFAALAAETSLTDTLDEIQRLVVQYRTLAAKRNEDIIAFRGRAQNISGFTPEFSCTVSACNDGTGDISSHTDRVRFVSDWENDVRRGLEEGVKAAIAAK